MIPVTLKYVSVPIYYYARVILQYLNWKISEDAIAKMPLFGNICTCGFINYNIVNFWDC